MTSRGGGKKRGDSRPKLLVVIPARSGSKSVPLKNIRILAGRPLLVHSVQYALRCKVVSRVIVSTDSEAIAKIAREGGAETPFLRSKRLAGDCVQDFPVVHDALVRCEKIYNERFDYVALLRPTSPLRPAGLIEEAVALMERIPSATSVRAVVEAEEHPYRVWRKAGRFIEPFVDEVEEPANMPRQKLPAAWFQSGDIELVRRSTLMAGSVSGGRVVPLLIERERMMDIDYPEDFVRANELIRKR